MAKGTVKWFNPVKGFGFILPAEGSGGDVFLHISAVERAGLQQLADGQPVIYELVEGKNGKSSAENLELDGPALEVTHKPRSDRPYGDRGGRREGGYGGQRREGGYGGGRREGGYGGNRGGGGGRGGREDY